MLSSDSRCAASGAAGTFAFRLAGPLLSQRIRISALVATAPLTSNGGFSGWARPAGMAAGAMLAWWRLPFVVVVVAAAGTAAMLRMLGVP